MPTRISWRIKSLVKCNFILSRRKISAVTELYTQIGIKAVCENKMREYYTRAMTSLGAVSVIEDKKSELKKLMKHLMYREM